MHVVGHPRIDGHDVIQLGLVRDRVDPRGHLPRQRCTRSERGDDAADDPQRVAIVVRQMVCDTGGLGVQVTAAPVAAFTSGGPPRKMVPWLRTITASSLIAGTYAPPAVHDPSTAAICGIPSADRLAWL